MHDESPSKTAFRVAQRRAEHQLLDDPLVFEDPLATRIIGSDGIARIEAERQHAQHPLSRHLRAFIAVRSRFAEDVLATQVNQATRTVGQYVILGAGLDTFAYRNPLAGLQVFEVDHPATQHWKQSMLRAAGIAIPSSLTFAPVDFERQTAAEALRKVGLKEDRTTFVSWLGVVPYLSEEAFAQTLAWIASLAGSTVVFDYATDPRVLGGVERAVFDAFARRVAQAGEPFRLFRDPTRLAAELHQVGFLRLEDLDAAEINARYFRLRADGLCIRGSIARIMRASH